ncbi:MAG TPA: prepilin-type N-terminal cleavage/methylation domain-containing protein [Pseudonocardiaceae bacterium]|nr:prepilin-type N-terminal cleavage/methylation domain-containing protein [Pseudonocardiaceae bacterium]
MLQRLRAARASQSGFTLIELLIVIVILGVLAGIVVFAVSAFNNDGVTAACKSDAKNVEVASEAYYAKTGGWAVDIAALKAANYLKQVPTSTKYAISYTAGSGTTEATVTGAITGGASCYP